MLYLLHIPLVKRALFSAGTEAAWIRLVHTSRAEKNTKGETEITRVGLAAAVLGDVESE